MTEETSLYGNIEETEEDVWGPSPRIREILESISRGNSTISSIVEDTNIKPERVDEILEYLQYCTYIDTRGRGVYLTRGGEQALRRRTRYG